MDAPEGLTLDRHRDLKGRESRPLVRGALLVVLSAILVAALLGVFGQRRVETRVASAAASLEVSAPTRLRGGLFFEARFRIEAGTDLENATLVLDPGWLEDITLNTLSPAPKSESSRDGRIALELGAIPAGDEHRLYLHFQVNPTAVGIRSQDVELYDGDRSLAGLDRTAWIWP